MVEEVVHFLEKDSPGGDIAGAPTTRKPFMIVVSGICTVRIAAFLVSGFLKYYPEAQ